MTNHSDILSFRNRRRHSRPAPLDGDFRTPAQRDRDRIIYAPAFRRLAEVTQVASPNHAQVLYNRLTHSLQVAQVGRSLAMTILQNSEKSLVEEVGGINPDVVEAACLAHDIGHPPFGHTAEKELGILGRKCGGFEGNAQSFRVVTKLAFKSEKYSGLDLTRATLAALLKYPWFKGGNPQKPDKWGAYKSELPDFRFARKRSSGHREKTPEAELMDWADDVTYSVHDIEDFFCAGIIPMHLLASAKENQEKKWFFDDIYRRRGKKFTNRTSAEDAFANLMVNWLIKEPYSGSSKHRSKLRYFSSEMVQRYVNGVKLNKSNGRTRVVIEPEYRMEVDILKELTWSYVIEAPALSAQHHGQREIILKLFDVYSEAAASRKSWSLFPVYYREQLQKAGSNSENQRVVIDLIAGMTEPQAVATYSQFMGLPRTDSLEQLVR